VVESKNILSKHPQLSKEWIDLCDWLNNYNFSFFGYIETKGKTSTLHVLKESGLGILSQSCEGNWNERFLQVLKNQPDPLDPIFFGTVPISSPIQRFDHLMHLCIQDKESDVRYHFIGLLKRSSLMVNNRETPLIREKMKFIFDYKKMVVGSHDYNQTIRYLMAVPKFELFRLSPEILSKIVEDLLSITTPSSVFSFQHEMSNHGTFILLVVPTMHLNAKTREDIDAYFQKKFEGLSYELVPVLSEHLSRFHIHLSSPTLTGSLEEITETIQDIVKPWSDRLKEDLNATYQTEKALDLYKEYVQAFPEHYQVRRSPQEAVQDIALLEKMREKSMPVFSLRPFIFENSSLRHKASVLCMYALEKIDLASFMPIFHHLGVHVYDEMTTTVGSHSRMIGHLHSFRISHQNEERINEPEFEPLITELLSHIFEGKASNDALNALVFKAKLSVRQIHILQMYRDYVLQSGAGFNISKINQALLTYTAISQLLAHYFETKFKPSAGLKNEEMIQKKEAELTEIAQQLQNHISKISQLSDDLLFKQLFSVLEATVRTNAYQNHAFIAIKLESKKIKSLPSPVPYREIFVHDVEMQGIHLRLGPVARGGIRWSDRLDDYRTEVLSLVKTQNTKNVVIVPVGSKGGFVIKKTLKTKEEASQESEVQYKKFIKGLLDVTDSIGTHHDIIHPENVLRYDAPDPYLVVAADKGTAMFSDIANAISEEYGFWLGDAFASGGSVGYNHKVVGITAKGAFECSKLHFKEGFDIDIEKDSVSVVGIGDMSGDVFGNGLLLSRSIKLVAAFNHQHIFLDPNPHPELSFQERKRLFDLPRSTWLDYNTGSLSKGGGIFERKAKEIQLNADIMALLGISQEHVTGDELIQYILKMKVDFIWFGGIGTYIKADDETNGQASDPANDGVRINASQCQAKVITEGANLGITQKARIALSQQGVRLNTDFIDNSAGVNMSDYEVNIKILLQLLLDTKAIASVQERNALLEKATEEVTELVLKNNVGQHRLLSIDGLRSKKNIRPFIQLLTHLVSQNLLDPVHESIPSTESLEAHASMGLAVSRPVLSVLQSYVKMDVFNQLVGSKLMTSDFLCPLYHDYFPQTFKKSYLSFFDQHRLRKEITATVITNKIVNQAGITFFFDVHEESKASFEDIVKAYLIVEMAIGAEDLRHHQDYEVLIQLESAIKVAVIELLKVSHSLNELLEKLPDLKENWKILCSVSSKFQKIDATDEFQVISGNINALEFGASLWVLNSPSAFKQTIQLLFKLAEYLEFEFLKKQIISISTQQKWESQQKEMLLQLLRQYQKRCIHLCQKNNIKEEALVPFLREIAPGIETTYLKSIQQLHHHVELSSVTVTLGQLGLALPS